MVKSHSDFRFVNLKLAKVDWVGPGRSGQDFQVDWAEPDIEISPALPVYFLKIAPEKL